MSLQDYLNKEKYLLFFQGNLNKEKRGSLADFKKNLCAANIFKNKRVSSSKIVIVQLSSSD